jgi:4-hydroxy-3-methylbut-2-enyl diphosphate reductase
MIIETDKNSGFCFGVVYAIQKAEEYLKNNNKLFCLGDIVHNDEEVKRLTNKGLQVIDFKKYKSLKNTNILIRAHGEPPETYKIAKQNNLNIIDASCPIVLRLQLQIRKTYLDLKKQNGQIIIYGKKNHAEVIGLAGQTNNEAIIVSDIADIEQIDFTRPVAIFSQTTKSASHYHKIVEAIRERMQNSSFFFQDSVCKQVANRDKEIRNFCKNKDIIIFISGKKSSNGKMLYEVCKSVNKNTKFVSEIAEIKNEWFNNVETVGISGATSTPAWLMDKVKEHILTINSNQKNKEK